MNQSASHGTHRVRTHVWIYALFVVLTSFFTYMYRFNYPTSPFWDEPYHIVSAQKYLNKVYFMEQHPPLAKLLIALGEKIVGGNDKNDQFIATDYATNIPAGFDFTGYRLFPTLLAWLTAPVLFFIFLFVTGNSPIAALLSFLYIFDNAQIVHSRGAMIDSTLTFLGMVFVLLFLHLQRKDVRTSIRKHCVLAALLGACFGLIMTTKIVGLIFILLFPLIIIRLIPDWKKIVLFLLIATSTFIIAYCSVWQIHFALGQKIVPELADDGYYQASPQFKSILKKKTQNFPSSFAVMLRDSYKFVTHYNKGVPRLDLCKEDENGSPSFFWPFGGRTINYRWEESGSGMYRYLYLQSNPVGWGLGLVGVVLSVILLGGTVFFGAKLRDPFLLMTFLGLYVGYMTAISQITRVMYLYHYFLPLLFSYILFGIVLMNIRQIGPVTVTDDRRTVTMTLLGFLIFGAFQFYRPLSYYEPIGDAAFKKRAIVELWELQCVRCPSVSRLVVTKGK